MLSSGEVGFSDCEIVDGEVSTLAGIGTTPVALSAEGAFVGIGAGAVFKAAGLRGGEVDLPGNALGGVL